VVAMHAFEITNWIEEQSDRRVQVDDELAAMRVVEFVEL
jgi:hypothetical protein